MGTNNRKASINQRAILLSKCARKWRGTKAHAAFKLDVRKRSSGHIMAGLELVWTKWPLISGSEVECPIQEAHVI